MPRLPIDHDMFVTDSKPEQATERKPKLPWQNWWSLDSTVVNFNEGWMLGPGRCLEPKLYPSKDVAETAAKDWVDAHEAGGCECGFGMHQYLGAYEQGKCPP